MPTLTKITTRPTTEINWFQYPFEIVQHQQTLKMASETKTLSNDGLSITRVMHFETQHDLDAFLNDPVLASIDDARAGYNTLHNITITTTVS
jgi:hypothetical protein